jgi:regulatory protein YycI of two-component signal transduction system YycFG
MLKYFQKYTEGMSKEELAAAFVNHVYRDQIELSYEKAMLQRNEWYKIATYVAEKLRV